MNVAVIILNFNGKTHLEYALPSIIENSKGNGIKVILVDNASIDDSISYANQYSELHIIKNNNNLGYSGGNNVGIRYALDQGCEYVILVNNDILVSSRWILDPVAYMETHKEVGIIGYNVYGDVERVSKDIFYKAVADFVEFECNKTNNVPGMALLIRSKVLQHVGLFDEVMFMYGEEDDLELRIQEAGYSIVRCNIPIWHYSEGTTRSYIPLRSSYLSYRNSLRIEIKYGGFNRYIKSSFRAIINVLNFKQDTKNNNSITRRMFPSNRAINTLIVLSAIFWNFINYIQTYNIRCAEKEMIDRFMDNQ
ncbi:MAG: glycosyltransferase family 2 protein [Proteobacteria bacterium]|nr:glycosyltransferase family 2 protein [Pseudomonadota bacterium]